MSPAGEAIYLSSIEKERKILAESHEGKEGEERESRDTMLCLQLVVTLCRDTDVHTPMPKFSWCMQRFINLALPIDMKSTCAEVA